MDFTPATPAIFDRRIQLLLIATAAAVWAIYPGGGLWLLAAGYGLAWLLWNLAVGCNLTRGLGNLSLISYWGLLLLIMILPVVTLIRSAPSFAIGERLHFISANTSDRLPLEQLPAIFPRTLYDDHPQVFYIHAPAARQVAVNLSESSSPLSAEPLGEGLFRLSYNPREQENISFEAESANIEIHVDGRSHRRRMQLVAAAVHPRWLTSHPDAGIAAAVSEETDELLLIQRNGNVQRVPVGDGPTDCLLWNSGRSAVVSHRYAPELWVVETSSGAISRKIPGAAFQVRLALAPDESLLAVAHDGSKKGLQLYSLPNLTPAAFLPLTFAPDWLCFGPSGNELIVSCRRNRSLYRLVNLLESDSSAEKLLSENIARFQRLGSGWYLDRQPISLSRPAVTLCRGTDGRTLYLANTTAQTDGEPVLGYHSIENTIHKIDTQSWKVVASFRTDRRTNRQRHPGEVDRGGSPMALQAVSADSLLVAFAGTHEVWEISTETGEPLQISDLASASLLAPGGVANLGNNCWCVTSPAAGKLAVYQGQELRKLIDLNNTLSPRQQLRRQGEVSFYETTRVGISCQSCHLHGDTDYCLHNIAQLTPVDVLTTRGAAGTAPYLRDASYARLRDLHDLADHQFRGYLRDEMNRPRAMEAYLEALPATATPAVLNPAPASELQPGVAAFVKARCNLCHAFPAFTNLSQHPQELLFPGQAGNKELGFMLRLDTPSLLRVGNYPPYLHNGRASNLEEVLGEQNRANRHGDVRNLSEAERAALLRFLESL